MATRFKAALVVAVVALLSLIGVRAFAAAVPFAALFSNDPQLTNPNALATDGVYLYVGEKTPALGDPGSNRIFKLPLSGGPAVLLYGSATPCCIQGLAVQGTDLYWIDPNGDPDATAIYKGPTSGGAITKIYSGFATGEPIVDGSGITSDPSNIYTADHVQGRIHRLAPNGTGITPLGSRYGGYFDLEHFNGIAQAGGVLYVVDEGEKGFPPKVLSIPVGGGSFTTLHTGAPLVHPDGIAVGNGKIYLSDPGAGNTIWQMPLGGGVPTAVVSGAPFKRLGRNGLVFHGGSLYVTDTGDTGATTGPGAIYRIEVVVPVENLTVSKSGPGAGAVTSNIDGIDCGDDCSEAFEKGSTVSLVATPAAGSSFDGWGGACAGQGRGTCIVVMEQARSVTATFAIATSVPGVSWPWLLALAFITGTGLWWVQRDRSRTA